MDKVECDVLVVGSGAGGLAAAVAAAARGLKVIVAEKAVYVGGTTALSGGFLWVPNNPVSRRDGILDDSVESARTYLRHEAGNQFNAATVDAFLAAGPEAIDFFETKTAVKFEAASAFSDYHPDAPGGRPGGRSIKAQAFRGQELGDELKRLRPPLPELTFVGLMIGSGPELKHFFNVTRSVASMAYVAKRLAGHARDLALYQRGMLLTNGNALAARLFRSALDLGVTVWTDAPVTRLIREDGAVKGAIVENNTEVEVRTARGVVLAAGGFPQDKERRRKMFPHDADNAGHFSPAPEGNTGDGLRLGEGIGAAVAQDYPNAAAWVPVSRVPRRGGAFGVFPHFIDRAKPGLIAVLATGKRFVNEANSYHDFCQALFKAGEKRAFLVVDKPFLQRFGLGFVKPFPVPVGPNIRSGYLKTGNTVAELAKNAGIDAANLEATLAEWNRDMTQGEDRAFGKGSTAYNRFNGDPDTKPNPCLAPIAQAPYYAVEVVVGDLGTFAGLRTDGDARVLDDEGRAIPGLYAAGNDAASIMGGNYPGGGITLGPAMTFGYIAARHMASR
ncbi:3-oxosteroid 1-dehydrogenase [Variibacter gotjawalensis]|uniref:3-oxosteroid 1-dehydrogenase n=1 Tax=Variibacter gotjawalensis TaxID=1333996 RepID=A0A0S3PQ75_9BRAD|nr:FAD-dependent oxidoreductase [Variibacter gotjawalensis]NIK48374.1 succinate dehydrogenase/fumarate reductase flavoprotein subunit [Variibacter gotjawalensis]RZS50241.1 succinate dehydrogenase/fumarate reductase flavoprotein subunit [Variibacter gotjawalensis]BAT58074.1 3-oxosteroid 1-dehydrogenase [Variibacter gotjawalensis]